LSAIRVSFTTDAPAPGTARYSVRFETLTRPLPKGCSGTSIPSSMYRGGKYLTIYATLRPSGLRGPHFCPGLAQIVVSLSDGNRTAGSLNVTVYHLSPVATTPSTSSVPSKTHTGTTPTTPSAAAATEQATWITNQAAALAAYTIVRQPAGTPVDPKASTQDALDGFTCGSGNAPYGSGVTCTWTASVMWGGWGSSPPDPNGGPWYGGRESAFITRGADGTVTAKIETHVCTLTRGAAVSCA
jgi:hypothetical protein